MERVVFTISVVEYIIVKRCIRISVNIMQMLDRITVCVCVEKKTRGKKYNEDYNYSSVRNIISRLWFSYSFSFKSLTETWQRVICSHIPTISYENPTQLVFVLPSLSTIASTIHDVSRGFSRISRVRWKHCAIHHEFDESPTMKHRGLITKV